MFAAIGLLNLTIQFWLADNKTPDFRGFKSVILFRQLFYHLIKYLAVADGQFGQHLAVDFYLVFLQYRGKPAPGRAIVAKGSVDADQPQGAEVALFVAAVAVSVFVCVEQGLAGGGKVGGAAVVKTLGPL
jgi:hypothetical protein